ncbi:NAD(P)-binding protein [Rhypophila decipiens]|uniref:NAD(P)-binding protein n=1 Tax=Rhypophila decipiens TaxID=261697 RepID=A0AAN6XTP0_9PEZI|nr:NAD(P)-binding protein [Rhypophila decipiens]
MPSQTASNFTKKIHHGPYETISPSRPALSQAGRTVLVTGASMGIGRAIARNFALAHATTVILVARNLETLEATLSELQAAALAANSPTKYIARQVDISNPTSVSSLFAEFASSGIYIDVLINNAAKISAMQPILTLGPEEVWSQFEANVRGPLILTWHFHNQQPASEAGKKKKYLVNVSTQAIHMFQSNATVQSFPSYSLTKQSGNSLMTFLAQEVDPASDMQIINFHPGVIFNTAWANAPKEYWPEFDHEDLPGQFAIWAASEEAQFLHGKFLWASWDLDEVMDKEGPIRKYLAENLDFLTVGVVGLGGTDWDGMYKPKGY